MKGNVFGFCVLDDVPSGGMGELVGEDYDMVCPPKLVGNFVFLSCEHLELNSLLFGRVDVVAFKSVHSADECCAHDFSPFLLEGLVTARPVVLNNPSPVRDMILN